MLGGPRIRMTNTKTPPFSTSGEDFPPSILGIDFEALQSELDAMAEELAPYLEVLARTVAEELDAMDCEDRI